MSVKERIKKFVAYKNISTRQFCLSIGVSEGFVSGMRKSMQPDKVTSIAAVYPDLNIAWLLTGEGEMINDSTLLSDVITPYSSGKSKKETQEETEIIYTTTLLPMRCMAGSLAMAAEYALSHNCEQINSPIGGVDFAMTISGESMSPEYPNGSQVLLKKIDQSAFIEWGRTYVLDTCNGPVLKKLEPSEMGKGWVRCVSVNSEYSPFDVSLEHVYGIYRVLMCLSRK